eukprot:29036-Pelagococcus_subviridis.AAC.2
MLPTVSLRPKRLASSPMRDANIVSRASTLRLALAVRLNARHLFARPSVGEEQQRRGAASFLVAHQALFREIDGGEVVAALARLRFPKQADKFVEQDPVHGFGVHNHLAVVPHAHDGHHVRALAVTRLDLSLYPRQREGEPHRVRPRGTSVHVGVPHRTRLVDDGHRVRGPGGFVSEVAHRGSVVSAHVLRDLDEGHVEAKGGNRP